MSDNNPTNAAAEQPQVQRELWVTVKGKNAKTDSVVYVDGVSAPVLDDQARIKRNLTMQLFRFLYEAPDVETALVTEGRNGDVLIEATRGKEEWAIKYAASLNVPAEAPKANPVSATKRSNSETLDPGPDGLSVMTAAIKGAFPWVSGSTSGRTSATKKAKELASKLDIINALNEHLGLAIDEGDFDAAKELSAAIKKVNAGETVDLVALGVQSETETEEDADNGDSA